MDRIITAIRELRKHFNEAQPVFAERLGISLRALASYESEERSPPLSSMMQFMKVADAEGRHDIGDVLQREIENELGGPILRQQHQEDFEALRDILTLRPAAYVDTRERWNNLSEWVKAARRAEHYKSAMKGELVQVIHQGLTDGLTDGQILAKVSKSDIEAAKALIKSLSEVARSNKGGR